MQEKIKDEDKYLLEDVSQQLKSTHCSINDAENRFFEDNCLHLNEIVEE